MIDNDIIGGLDCCLTTHNRCTKCPYATKNPCSEKLREDALNLINRKNAEIDILIRKKETLRDEIAGQQAEIERLQREQEIFGDIGKLYSEVKTEAYKEFAERLKERAFVPDMSPTGARVVEAWEIDETLTELTER